MKIKTVCPSWCAGSHHCTARLPSGEHTSTPEVWDTDVGKVVVTRHLRTRGGHVELRIVVPLPEGEQEAVGFMRHLVVAAYSAVAETVGSGSGLKS